MDLTGLLERRIGIESLHSSDVGGVFSEVAEALVKGAALPDAQAARLRDAFLKREGDGTTAFGFGMAIPHVFSDFLTSIHVVVARHARGLDMGAIDGQTTKTLFCVAGPDADRSEYLELLGTVARTLRQRQWRRFIEQAATTDEIFEILVEAQAETG